MCGRYVCGVSTFGLGVSGGTYTTDENCERIKLSKVLNDLGMKVLYQFYVKTLECSLQWNNQVHLVRLKVKLVKRNSTMEKI